MLFTAQTLRATFNETKQEDSPHFYKWWEYVTNVIAGFEIL